MADWTPDQIEKLKALAESGASRTRIAAHFRRSMSAVVATAKLNGIRIRTAAETRKANGLSGRWANNR